MSIRMKLLLAMMVPLGLLIAQLVSMNVFIRELQDAVALSPPPTPSLRRISPPLNSLVPCDKRSRSCRHVA